MCIKLGTTKHQTCAGPIDQQYAGEEKKKIVEKIQKKKKKNANCIATCRFQGNPIAVAYPEEK